MTRNLLSETNLTQPFAHFPDEPGMAIRSDDLRPVFDSLDGRDQEWARYEIARFDRTDVEGVARKLGVGEAVACGLIVLLHPDA